MTRPPQKIVRVRCIVFCLALTFFILPSSRCGTTKIRQVARASGGIKTSIGSMVNLLRSLGQNGAKLILLKEEVTLSKLLMKADSASKALLDQAYELQNDPKLNNPDNRRELASLFGNVRKSITDLDKEGISQITNSKAREKFKRPLNNINDNLLAIGDALGCVPITDKCVKCPPDGKIICW